MGRRLQLGPGRRRSRAASRIAAGAWLFLFAVAVVSCAPSSVAVRPQGEARLSKSESAINAAPEPTPPAIDPKLVLGPAAAPPKIAPSRESRTRTKKNAAGEPAQPPKSPANPADAGADQSSPEVRSDNRPAWWIDAPTHENGEVMVAAEALAPDLRGARRAAVDAGLRALKRALGAEPDDWIVRAATIRPLRAVRGPESVNRFVGYVLIVAPEPK